MSEAITDKDRMNFLETQTFTRWVGHGWHREGNTRHSTTWPVFKGMSFRAEVDKAILSCARWVR